MSGTKYLKGPCQVCGGHLEFPAVAVGTSIDCPHCGKVTELMLAIPPEEPTIPRRTIIWTAVTVLVLLLGLAGALVALKRVETRAATNRQATNTVSTGATAPEPAESAQLESVTNAGFRASEITLQKASGGSLVYAVGTLTNASARQRFGVKIYLDLLDAAGQKVGQATDYQQTIEPKGQWNFKALVVDSKAVSATVAEIKEDQ